MSIQELICGGAFNLFEGQILHISQYDGTPLAIVNPIKLTVHVAAGVAADVIILHSQANKATIDVMLADDAKLGITEVFTAESFVEFGVNQAAGSSCEIIMAELSSANVMYNINLDGANAESRLHGVFLATGEEHCVVSVRTNHNSSDCRSESLVKGVVADCAVGEFRGLVYVAPDAQRTDARQQSRNIELSDTAHITTRPQLEIYADDVKCSHGATVGQVNADAILYMRQRGLSEQQARRIQIEGFVDDVLMKCNADPLCEVLMHSVTEKLETL